MRINTEIRSWLAPIPMSIIIFSTLKEYFFLHQVFSSPCQWKCQLLPSLGIRRPLTFHILMFSKTACPNEQKFSSYRNHLWKVFYYNCSFCLDRLKNMATTHNSCFWLVNFLKFFSSETQLPNEQNLVGSTYGKFCIRFP